MKVVNGKCYDYLKLTFNITPKKISMIKQSNVTKLVDNYCHCLPHSRDQNGNDS